MATFKNVTDFPVDIPLLNLHVQPEETFEVPDELAPSLEANPHFASSRAKNPTVTVDPVVAEQVTTITGPVPILQPDLTVPTIHDTGAQPTEPANEPAA